nr:cyclin-D1-1 [Tanacetum cinerariifolium]
MEFLVLSVLDWRLRSITPFSFIGFFAHKIDPTGTYTGFLISRATQIILSNVQEASLLEYWPSCIAAATILCAASDLSNFSLINAEHAESWCDGLSKEKITKCYRLVQGMSPLNRSITKFSKIVPVQVRVMTRTSTESGDSSSSSSSPSSYKRRKLNNSSWLSSACQRQRYEAFVIPTIHNGADEKLMKIETKKVSSLKHHLYKELLVAVFVLVRSKMIRIPFSKTATQDENCNRKFPTVTILVLKKVKNTAI